MLLTQTFAFVLQVTDGRLLPHLQPPRPMPNFPLNLPSKIYEMSKQLTVPQPNQDKLIHTPPTLDGVKQECYSEKDNFSSRSSTTSEASTTPKEDDSFSKDDCFSKDEEMQEGSEGRSPGPASNTWYEARLKPRYSVVIINVLLVALG